MSLYGILEPNHGVNLLHLPSCSHAHMQKNSGLSSPTQATHNIQHIECQVIQTELPNTTHVIPPELEVPAPIRPSLCDCLSRASGHRILPKHSFLLMILDCRSKTLDKLRPCEKQTRGKTNQVAQLGESKSCAQSMSFDHLTFQPSPQSRSFVTITAGL